MGGSTYTQAGLYASMYINKQTNKQCSNSLQHFTFYSNFVYSISLQQQQLRIYVNLNCVLFSLIFVWWNYDEIAHLNLPPLDFFMFSPFTFFIKFQATSTDFPPSLTFQAMGTNLPPSKKIIWNKRREKVSSLCSPFHFYPLLGLRPFL